MGVEHQIYLLNQNLYDCSLVVFIELNTLKNKLLLGGYSQEFIKIAEKTISNEEYQNIPYPKKSYAPDNIF
jgi:hypothetical protein